MMLRPLAASGSLSHISELIVNLMAPPRRCDFPMPDPISRLLSGHEHEQQNSPSVPRGVISSFVNGGPVVCFQSLEPDMNSGKATAKHRAVILYVPISHCDTLPSTSISGASSGDEMFMFQPPVWCIPESFFPSKKLDTLPPRTPQPCLLFSRYPARLGSKCFEPSSLMKALTRLDQLVLMNLKLTVPGLPAN